MIEKVTIGDATLYCGDCLEVLPSTDWDEPAADDDPNAPHEFGCCLPPGECCMPGLHFPSECHTAADYERAQFGGWATQPTRNA